MKNMIMERLGCTEKMAELIAARLKTISPELQPKLDSWLDTGKVDDEEVCCGYSVKSLMERYDMRFTGALLTVDWLLRDPEAAKKALAEGIK